MISSQLLEFLQRTEKATENELGEGFLEKCIGTEPGCTGRIAFSWFIQFLVLGKSKTSSSLSQKFALATSSLNTDTCQPCSERANGLRLQGQYLPLLQKHPTAQKKNQVLQREACYKYNSNPKKLQKHSATKLELRKRLEYVYFSAEFLKAHE